MSSAGIPRATLFAALLVIGTTVPFLAAWLTYASPVFLSLQATNTYLAAIHVPMTIYLLFDPEVRNMMRRHPIALVAMPGALFALGVFVFTYLTYLVPDGRNWPLVWFLIVVLGWQYWHFGKQNVGVYSFVRTAQNSSSMSQAERRLIVASSALGVVAAFLSVGDLVGRAPLSDFTSLLAVTFPVRLVALVAQLALLAGTIFYMLRHRSRLSWGSGLVLFLSANFFLPYYVTLGRVSMANVFACSVFGHGVQYLIFLLFHALTYADGTARKRVLPFVRPAWNRAAAFSVFAVAILITGELYWFHAFLPEFWVGRQVAHLVQFDNGGAMSSGLAAGILLAHFWFDSFVWRLKNPESRSWVMRRYAFIFSRAVAKTPVPV
jgi:hypothetical protein